MRRWTGWPALVGLVALAAAWGQPDPAAAHSGSRAELYLADLRLQPVDPAGWTVHVLLTDRDSGQPLPGFDVQITGLGPSGDRFGPVTLRDPEARGRYSATVAPHPGAWSITVDARGFPGGAEGIPLRQKAEIQLTPGVETGGGIPPGPGGDSRHGGTPMLWVLPAALALLIGGWALATTLFTTLESGVR